MDRLGGVYGAFSTRVSLRRYKITTIFEPMPPIRRLERTVCILTLLSCTDSGVGKLTLTMTTETMARLTSVMAFVPLFFGISYSRSYPVTSLYLRRNDIWPTLDPQLRILIYNWLLSMLYFDSRFLKCSPGLAPSSSLQRSRRTC